MITQIGSLPYKDVRMAVEYSLRHDIPFLPELPDLGEAMFEYIKTPGQLSCLDEWKEAVRGYGTVKIQCVGPATLLFDPRSDYSAEEAVDKSYEHIFKIVNGLDVGKIILFLDEPSLGYVGFDYQELWEPLFASFDVIPGVHVCGNMNWDQLFDSDLVKIISFDASKEDITIYDKYRNDKRIAWGVNRTEEVKDFRGGDLLTLPCGMDPAKYVVEDCERNLEKLIEIAKRV
ncbi:hypothetical protein GOV03_01755 [Candidatus Woesearchaeota archaeon]|nr:hypothetical protein [Candidatus Woesearchaeota archaeon]